MGKHSYKELYEYKFYSKKMNITYVEQTELKGLAHAIKLGIDGINNKFNLKNHQLLIILGDTIIEDNLQSLLKPNYSFVGFKKVDDYKIRKTDLK